MPEENSPAAETTAVGEPVVQPPGSGLSWLVPAALVLPVITGTVLLFVKDPSLIGYLTYATLGITALCLALDRWLRPVPNPGSLDKYPVVLFLVMVAVWVVAYPAAFFSRQPGRRNPLGWISILVAVFFVACMTVPKLLEEYAGLSCDHPKVQAIVSDLVRQQPFAWGIQQFRSFGEIGHDPSTGSRKGWCEVVTREGTFEVFFTLEADPQSWWAQRVRLLGIGPLPCGNPVVLRAAKQILQQNPQTSGLKSLTEVREISHDPANKVRLGRGIAVTLRGRIPVRIKVAGNEDATVDYLVMAGPEILPHCASQAIRDTVATLLHGMGPAGEPPTIERIEELDGAVPGERRLGECVYRANGEVRQLRFLVEWASPLALEYTVRLVALPD
jgi:hypothetical protein